MGIPDADYTNPTEEAGWQHALTIPRELSVRDGKLIQEPIEELKQLRSEDKAVLYILLWTDDHHAKCNL